MNIWATNAGFYCGFEVDRVEGAAPALTGKPIRYTGDRHICIIAPNGAGKTKRLLIPALHDLTGYSVVVADIKGELRRMTEAHRQAAGNLIIGINPFDVLGMGSSGANPIAALADDDDLPDNALELAEAVIRVESRDPHWSQAAQEVIAALVMYTRLVIPGGSFADVRELLGRDDAGIRSLVKGGHNVDTHQFAIWQKTPKEKRDPTYVPPVRYKGKLLPGMIAASIIHNCPEIETKIARFSDINPEDREMHGVLGTALTQTRWLDSRPIKRDLAKNPFDFSILKERPVTVYLTLPARRLGTHSTWLRLMVASVVQKLMRDTSKPKVPVLLMLDEYAALAGGSGYGAQDNSDGFPIIARNMAMFRGYSLKLLSVFQDLPQAKRIYGEGFSSFLANAGVVQIFAAQDYETSEYFSKLTGQRTLRSPSQSQSRAPAHQNPQGVSITDSHSVNLIPQPLMLAQDIRAMNDGFSLIFSHKAKGVVRSYVPYPTELPHLKAICALDPGA